MRRMKMPGILAASLLTALSSSCGIRLPIDTNGTQPMVRRSEVRAQPTAEKPAQDPDVLVWLIADKYHTGMVFPFDWLEQSGFIAPPTSAGRNT